MGLDVVEVFMRTEEVFGFSIPDAEAGSARTVGALYELVCLRLGLPPSSAPLLGCGTAASLKPFRPEHTFVWKAPWRVTPPPAAPLRPELACDPPHGAWNREDVWATLAALIVDQLGIEPEEVRYDARWGEDLRAD